MKAFLLLCLVLAGLSGARDLDLMGYVGPTSPDGKWDPSVAWNVHAMWNIDQMVLAGTGLGYEGGNDAYLPLTGRLMVRLPFGRQALPFVDGELGVGVKDVLSQSLLVWKAGGGVDQKLGDHSSLLMGGGFQTHGRFYLRAGLLLEL
jgi:hypothetical protein